MRALFASSLRTWGGGEEWFTRASEELQARGHDVVLAVRPGSALEHRASRRGVRVIPIPFGGLLDPRAPLALSRVLSRQDTEIAIANLDKELTDLALASMAHPKLALLVRRGSEHPAKATPLYRWLFEHRVKRVLVNSPGVAETLRHKGLRLSDEIMELIPNGLEPLPDSDPDPARQSDWPPGDGPRLIVVGELAPRKNPQGVLRALAKVKAPWRLLWIGDGRLRHEIRQWLAEYSHAERVRFMGDVPDARCWTAVSDLLILSSRSEGQPWSVLEAMVEGVPVVCSRLPGLEELVEDGVTGRVVEFGDEDALAAVVGECLADPTKTRALGEAGRQRVRKAHGAKIVFDALEAVLERIRFETVSLRRVVFVDRDGTITAEVGALGRPEGLQLLPDVGEALRTLRQSGYEIVVVTNQAAVGRGQISLQQLQAVHARLRQMLRAEGVELAGIFFCPHRPEDNCFCRKPKPGLLENAARSLGFSPSHSWLIGDSSRDVGAAEAFGVPSVMVNTGWAGEDPAARADQTDARPVMVKPNLLQAVHWILSRGSHHREQSDVN